MTPEALCAAVEGDCACIEPVDHAGAHVCECKGSWRVRDDGVFEIVVIPGGAEPTQANLWAALDAALGLI